MRKYGPVILTVILLASWGFFRHNAEGGIKRRSVELTFWHSMSIYQGDTLERLIEEYNNNNEDIISSDTSKIKVMRLQTNEELVIAMDTSEIVSEMLESA